MSTIVVRASDTALAMDEVVKRLGQDAYILSTKQKNGQVEIRATTEAPKVQRRAPRIEGGGKTFGEILAERSAHGKQPRIPEPVEVADIGAPQQPAFRPDVSRPMGGWPGLVPGFVADLWVELGRPEGQEGGFFGQLCDTLLDETHVAGHAERILVVGPSGAGKTLTASRLAALAMTERAGVRPHLVAPRKARLMAADELSAHARLMGIRVDRPLVNELKLGPDWALTDPHAPQIFDLSDMTPADAKGLVIEGKTEVVLCLPSGLHPGMIARHLAAWRDLAPSVCLTRVDEWTPTPEELSAIAASGLKLALWGMGGGLIDTLLRPVRADLRTVAQGWLTPVVGDHQ